ncbi:MAG: molybdenum cofactor biosynthesis protein MoaE [Bauldia sp.]|nr:molybdenum cofactor biosynthesis protein MoaE [Bauldia sp.]MCW5717485.1 molybdenum cofactor biosynthesis protein MoaE [Bauldia sp.]
MLLRTRIAVTAAPLDVPAELAELRRGLPDAGAMVSFVGTCRSEGGRLSGLELEHYPAMAEAEFERIVREAAARWPILAMAMVHRTGRVTAGEDIVVVAALSEHRAAAFGATEFAMDFLKTSAPFWKREIAADGSALPWSEARTSDQAAAARWQAAGDPDA